MTSSKIGSVVVAMTLCIFAVPVEAGTISLNDIYNGGNPFVSDNYTWVDVLESNGAPSDAAFNYYRDPTMIGNSLVVNPTNFRVDVTPGPGLLEIGSRLEMVITGTSGATIPFLSFTESGDFEINALNADDAIVTATVDYFFEVLDGPNAGATGMGMEMFEMIAAPSNAGSWSLDFDIDVPDGATQVYFEFENRVMADAHVDLSSAFIAKKVVEGIKITVPEPSAAFLLLLGCFAAAIPRPRS
jgi:hypothetical protein